MVVQQLAECPEFSRRDLRVLGQLLNPATRYYVWSWRDPGPFFSDARSIIGKALHRGK